MTTTIRYKNCATPRSFYKDYLKLHPRDSKNYCDYRTYMRVVRTVLTKYKNYIIYDAGIMNVPFRLGRIAIKKYKMSLKRLPIDWGLTRLEGKRMVSFNDDTNGYKYRVYWNKKACVVKNKTYYSFYFVRDNNRELAKAIQNKITDYYQFN